MIVMPFAALIGALSYGILLANAPQRTDVCSEPPKSGFCWGNILRYYYDPASGRCLTFNYGGCFGNKNRFETEKECLRVCKGASPTGFVCPEPYGFFPHETECKMFYQCVANVPYLKTCDPGTDFSPVQGLCDWPKNVDCGGDDPEIPRCEQHQRIGPCTFFSLRFYFSIASGRCEAFTYGGCRGNSNNFRTIEECQATCPTRGQVNGNDVCQLEKKVGPCDSFQRRYYYNRETGKCEDFLFSGCRANGNNFRSKSECQETCERGTEFICPQPEGMFTHETQCNMFYQCEGGFSHLKTCRKGTVFNPETEVCDSPKNVDCGEDKPSNFPCGQHVKVGPCIDFKTRFYFHMNTGKCEEFNYGGCRGNSNNFKTIAECENACPSGGFSDFTCPEPYGLFAHEAECDLFYQCANGVPYQRTCQPGTVYSSEEGTCDWPQNVDCGGDDPTKSTCEQDMRIGPCTYGGTRHYYNKNSGRCERFTYGGCRGNSNNFRTIEECEATCPSDTFLAPKACTMRKDQGRRCGSEETRYFFNKRFGKCETFMYLGCGGNQNNFESKSVCEDTCLRK